MYWNSQGTRGDGNSRGHTPKNPWDLFVTICFATKTLHVPPLTSCSIDFSRPPGVVRRAVRFLRFKVAESCAIVGERGALRLASSLTRCPMRVRERAITRL